MVQIYQSAGPSSWPKIIASTYYVRTTYEKHQQSNSTVKTNNDVTKTKAATFSNVCLF